MAPPYGRVTERHAKIAIVASGTSLECANLKNLSDDVFVISVNGAINLSHRSDAFFTLDPSFHVRKLIEVRKEGCRYFMAVPDDYGSQMARIPSHRMPPEGGVTFLKRIAGHGVFKSKERLSEDPSSIHTGNSAYGALGLAYHMNPNKIAFLGLDGTQDRYAYSSQSPRYSLSHLPELFRTTIHQLSEKNIMVLNGSLNSRIDCFNRCTPNDAIDWINN